MRIVSTLLLSAYMVVSAGCGPQGPDTAPVSGNVTYASKPVTSGTIRFWSNTGGALATGQLGPDGSYRLTTHPYSEGAVLGSHQVTITVDLDDPATSPKSFAEERPVGRADTARAASLVRVPELVPQRYEDRNTSPLTAEVKTGPNTIDFNLPAEK